MFAIFLKKLCYIAHPKFPNLPDDIQALGIHSLSYIMPSKTLAAKASVLNNNLDGNVKSSFVREPEFTEDGFYNDFSKMLG